MPFTPKNWQDTPSTATPITAAALEDLETRVTDYTDTAGGGGRRTCTSRRPSRSTRRSRSLWIPLGRVGRCRCRPTSGRCTPSREPLLEERHPRLHRRGRQRVGADIDAINALGAKEDGDLAIVRVGTWPDLYDEWLFWNADEDKWIGEEKIIVNQGDAWAMDLSTAHGRAAARLVLRRRRGPVRQGARRSSTARSTCRPRTSTRAPRPA